ncbi:uncharacterized protein LOC135500023 isoform X2 [Lineus longissimus]|uniref:uncharacterized protein LOC135500023 isoform X2 n=1 Tax=Lineus longissimus TaxID=88925 RepID=UPI00315D3EA6
MDEIAPPPYLFTKSRACRVYSKGYLDGATMKRFMLAYERKRAATDLDEARIVRMMERAGFTRTMTSQDTRTWFEDDRYTTQRQADYLTKLRRLRSELINQESSNLTNAMDRLNNQQIQGKDSRPMKLKGGRRNPLMDSGPDSFPSRHMRLMQEKHQRILQHRTRKASPKLETIEGKQLVDPTLKDDNGSTTSKSRSEGDETARDLVRRMHKEKDIAPVFRNLIQPTHSIPNIGTRALRRSDKELNIDSEQNPNASDSACVKPLNIPKRTPYGQKDYKLRGLLDGSKDEMVVNPAALQYLNYQYDEQSGGYYVPVSSPVEGMTAEEADSVGNGSSETLFRLERIHIPNTERHAENLSYHKPKARPRVIVSDPKNIPVYKSSVDDEEGPDSRFPEIHTKKLQRNRGNPENNPLEGFRSESKKQIVVEMPNIMFMPSTPEPPYDSEDNYLRQGPLTKALTQNKIREREVRNLLQDVKDLNQITEQLEERAKIEEANR